LARKLLGGLVAWLKLATRSWMGLKSGSVLLSHLNLHISPQAINFQLPHHHSSRAHIETSLPHKPLYSLACHNLAVDCFLVGKPAVSRKTSVMRGNKKPGVNGQNAGFVVLCKKGNLEAGSSISASTFPFLLFIETVK
jgi:hypothetical protein